jgi:hypothetical protein
MTILKITVEDKQAGLLRKLLEDVSYVKNIEEEHLAIVEKHGDNDNDSVVNRIKKILDEAKGKDLFKDIEDPSEWQREIRKEWDRDS